MEEIVAKKSIYALNEQDRRCQENPQDECTNKKYTDGLLSKCQCLPFQLRFLAEKV